VEKIQVFDRHFAFVLPYWCIRTDISWIRTDNYAVCS